MSTNIINPYSFAAAAADIEFIETTAIVAGTGAASYSDTAVAINATGPSRKLVASNHYEAAADRTVTRSYNTVAFTQSAVNTSGTGASHTWQGYIDEANLPTDAANHTLAISSSDGNFAPIFVATHYRNVASGAPSDTGVDDGGVGEATSVTLTTTVGGLVVTTCGNNSTGGSDFTASNSENERVDTTNSTINSLWVGDIVGVAGTSQTTGSDPSAGNSRQVSAHYAKAA